jgi:hypothetical protein
MSKDFCLTPQVAVKYYEGLYMKVVIVGATGGTGLEICGKRLDANIR